MLSPGGLPVVRAKSISLIGPSRQAVYEKNDMSATTPVRVIAYVDGFNLYFGLRDKGWRQLYWLNLHLLAQNLLKPGQQLVRTKYFTARISGPKPNDPAAKQATLRAKVKRQGDFLEALATLATLDIFYGHYLGKVARCFACGNTWDTFEEKMTDVNIATEMLADAFEDKYDAALLISADSDLVAPVRTIRRLFPQKRIVVACPPARHSTQLRSAAHASFVIGRAKLAASQFPDQVPKPGGHILHRPAHWK